jgi:hypothetical protein
MNGGIDDPEEAAIARQRFSKHGPVATENTTFNGLKVALLVTVLYLFLIMSHGRSTNQ